mmetsp:Transcript_17463/g.43544  ORF Transcript_17463/g.43544 Transcript_17463/m.43544 type:complete len:201 (-) Transcript_17463:863-1465(-)|eukprot:CAMPEP_0113880698 /NCGR_PEP_ID=MMETSP0780_2-20120614/7937_1 /TAXON_ID=652834 /ORGANISM="Palpitomonas bilix" /LENGTH=200 /DNA_ID=CAMNT_0000867417 /DNA_START=113 /DNA_END=715 /DNA_ORIENTATION=+ /assembly_acc=CAM_ASM_000599
MSFFGITALGAPNPFENLTFFKTIPPEDWKEAFDLLKEGKAVSVERMEDLLFEAAGKQEAPAEEKDLFFELVRESGLEEFSWTDLGQIVEGVLELQKKPHSTEFKSGVQQRERLHKHTRVFGNPQEKHTLPMTASQEYGWKSEPNDPFRCTTDFKKKTCELTQYEEAILRHENGRSVGAEIPEVGSKNLRQVQGEKVLLL